jgi:hypothetical protein
MTAIRARFPSTERTLRSPCCPRGLIGAVALILVAECYVAPRARVPEPTGRVELSWRAAARAAAGTEGSADILCVGDSLIKLGILPSVLEDRLGSTAYNLGVLGGQAPNSYYLLRTVLETGNRPRAVIVDFSEHLLTFAPGLNAACWADRVGWRNSLDLAWQSTDPAMAISTGLHLLLTGWCDQSDRRTLLGFGRQRTLGETPADDPRVFERNWRLNRGAQVAPRAFVPVDGASSEAGEQWRPHPANAFYLDRLLLLAEAYRIPVYWILTPSIPDRREWLEQSGVSAAHRRFVLDRAEEHSCVTVLDGEHLAWSVDAFRDPLHLNRDGAVRLSLVVTAAIAPRLGGESSGPRWIDLGGIADQETSRYQNLVEDLDQSKAAVAPIDVGQSSREVPAW